MPHAFWSLRTWCAVLVLCVGLTAGAGAATVGVTISNFAFTPSIITINLGDTVIWTNNSGTTHTATSTTGVWDSGNISTGSTYALQFNTGGTFPYQDSFFASRGMTGTVNVIAPPVITSPTTAPGSVGAPFAYATIASGATSYAAIGVPPGLTLNATTGVISGVPTTAGSNSVTITATNSAGSGTATVAMTIALPANGAPVIDSPSQAFGTIGGAFRYTLFGSNNPTIFTAAGLPSGLLIDMTTGIITGSGSAASVSDVIMQINNANGYCQTTMVVTISSASTTTGATTTATGTSGGTTGGNCGLGGGGLGMLALVLLGTLRLRALRSSGQPQPARR